MDDPYTALITELATQIPLVLILVVWLKAEKDRYQSDITYYRERLAFWQQQYFELEQRDDGLDAKTKPVP